MKNRFWVYIALLSAISLVAVALGGLYFLIQQEGQRAKDRMKKSLSRQNAFYLKELNKNLVTFLGEAENAFQGKDTPPSSLFSALVLIDLKKNEVRPVFSPVFGTEQKTVSEKVFGEFLQFTDTLKQKIIRESFWFHFLSDREGGQGWVVFVFSPQTFPESQILRWAGLVKKEDFFKFSETSDREALIISSQGRLFFSFQPKSALSFSKPALGTLLKKGEKKKPAGWYVRRRGGSHRGNNLFHVKPWPETNLFVISGGRLSPPLFVWTDSSGPWLLFCFFLWIFLFLGLFLIVQPLFSAYGALREDFIHVAKLGRKPALSKSSNPFLYFYNQLVSEKEGSSLENTKNQEHSIQTFQELLREEERWLKQKFPGFVLKTRLDTSVSLDRFYKFAKKILHELLLNAIEAMGSKENQEVIVSTRQEGEVFILSVRDHGPGLSESEKKKAFELYHSTKSHLGVGLNLVQSIVSSHGGAVKLNSFPEGGLEVQVSLPMKCFLNSQSKTLPESFIKKGKVMEGEKDRPLSSPSSRALH